MQTIRQNPLAWIVQAVGLLVVILNLWLAYQLTPISQDIDRIISRVSAIEAEQVRNEKNHEDIAIIKIKVDTVQQDVRDIKNFLNVR